MSVAGATGTRSGERTYLAAIAALTASFLAAFLTWGFSSPAFFGPDEPMHVNSVSRLLSGGGWPEPYTAKIKGSTYQALTEAGSPTFRLSGQAPLTDLPAPADRSALVGPTQYRDAGRDQMVQHPPGYYLVVAGALQVAGGTSLPWDTALVVLRVVSAILAAAAIPFVVGVARRLTGSRRAGLVGGASLLAVPFYSTMAGFVTNDSLLLLTVAATFYAGVRAATAVDPRRWLVLAGVALGASLLVKGLALMAIPVVGTLSLAAVLRAAWTWRARVLWLLVPQVVAFAVGGWWWLRNLVVLGTLQPSQCAEAARCSGIARRVDDPLSLLGYAQHFLDRYLRLFWGRGARADIAYPEPLVWFASAVLLLVLVLGVVLARHRVALVLLLLYPVLITAITFRNAHAVYLSIGEPDRGVQGRYVFSGLPVVAGAVAAVVARLPRRGVLRALPSALVALSALITLGGWAWVFQRQWVFPEQRGIRDGLSAAADSVGVATWTTPAALTAFVVAVAVTALLTARVRDDEPASEAEARTDLVAEQREG